MQRLSPSLSVIHCSTCQRRNTLDDLVFLVDCLPKIRARPTGRVADRIGRKARKRPAHGQSCPRRAPLPPACESRWTVRDNPRKPPPMARARPEACCRHIGATDRSNLRPKPRCTLKPVICVSRSDVADHEGHIELRHAPARVLTWGWREHNNRADSRRHYRRRLNGLLTLRPYEEICIFGCASGGARGETRVEFHAAPSCSVPVRGLCQHPLPSPRGEPSRHQDQP